MKYFSMFSGIGGFEYGLQQAQHDFECVGYSEIDRYARSIYERHYPNHTNYGDATKINTKDLQDFEFLVGGFPCQAFSIAGKRKGFNDTRGTLFFEIARILKDKRPKYFLLENVKGLLSHEGGETIQTIFRICDELRYDVSWSIYNSKDYGVPQNRERIFIKGYIRGECGRKVLSATRDCNEVDGKLIKLNDKAQAQTIYDINGLATTLSANGGGQGGKTGLYKINKVGNVSPSNHHNGDVFSTEGIGRTLCARDYKDAMKIEVGDMVVRRLTPIECERLQGFPDNFTKYGKDEELISDTQRYKCLGNAVTTNVITAIVNEMFEEVI